MIVIRNVFQCKPGAAKELVKSFKAAEPLMKEAGMSAPRIMTDLSAPFWTVVLETEAESLEQWERNFREFGSKPEMQNAMKGYMEHVVGGHREIWRIE